MVQVDREYLEEVELLYVDVTNRRLVLRATGGIAICQVIRRQVRKEECNVY